MLVPDFVGRAPDNAARITLVRHIRANDARQRAVVEVRTGPAARHVALVHGDGEAVHAVVLRVVLRDVVAFAGEGVDVLFVSVPGVEAGVGLLHLLLAEQTHGEALAHHDAVPALQHVGDAHPAE